ncbi:MULTISPECIES: hypothetical protein [unclassified Caballeronia]|uniref:hypothetical protein n=1 Tax=unclassified Caballeronia TaxID=2646786 RepID=UPI0020292BBE|nr:MULTISPECIES: hypothetical protein [unclassified Caballeronia]
MATASASASAFASAGSIDDVVTANTVMSQQMISANAVMGSNNLQMGLSSAMVSMIKGIADDVKSAASRH